MDITLPLSGTLLSSGVGSSDNPIIWKLPPISGEVQTTAQVFNWSEGSVVVSLVAEPDILNAIDLWLEAPSRAGNLEQIRNDLGLDRYTQELL